MAAVQKLRNAVNIENASTKTDYFTQKLGEANNDIKETWKILNSALGKRSKTTTIHKLEVNDNDVSDPKMISDELNSYFCNIVENILKDSDNPSVSNASFEPFFQKFLNRTHYLNLNVSHQIILYITWQN